jgi:hypothetical protein
VSLSDVHDSDSDYITIFYGLKQGQNLDPAMYVISPAMARVSLLIETAGSHGEDTGLGVDKAGHGQGILVD